MKICLLLVSGLLIYVSTIRCYSQSSGGIGIGKGSHPVVESKPEPDWPKSTESSGPFTIVLRAVFNSKGKVTNIQLIQTIPEQPAGMTQKSLKRFKKAAIKAAKQISFKPAQKDGHPVSMWMQLEYNFSLDGKDKYP
jgi:hypothetical protein